MIKLIKKPTIAVRTRWQNEAYKDRPPLMCDGRWVYGIWMVGNYYKRKVGYHGEYPPSYLKRVLTMFPDARRRLHAFAGMVDDPGSLTVDENPHLGADYASKVESMPFLPDDYFDLAMADPPYTEVNAKEYGTKMSSRKAALREIARVVKPGGHIVWLDVMCPQYSNEYVHRFGSIGLETGTCRVVRLISMFEVV